MLDWLTDEQRALRDMAEAFARKEVEPLANQIDRDEQTPDDLLKKTAEFGLYGLYIPPEYGGSGVDVTTVIPPEELARLRERVSAHPHDLAVLERRLTDARAESRATTANNERLASTLREARDQIIALKGEVDRLAQPPTRRGARRRGRGRRTGGGGRRRAPASG